jgi:hypothetical protein
MVRLSASAYATVYVPFKIAHAPGAPPIVTVGVDPFLKPCPVTVHTTGFVFVQEFTLKPLTPRFPGLLASVTVKVK